MVSSRLGGLSIARFDFCGFAAIASAARCPFETTGRAAVAGGISET